MSTDWNIKCVDCGDVHGFDDANHMDQEMLILIKHADSIAALADLVAECGSIRLGFEYDNYGPIDPVWFRKHLGHQLMPIDEYGRLLDRCSERVTCGECETSHWCTLTLGHDGACKTVRT